MNYKHILLTTTILLLTVSPLAAVFAQCPAGDTYTTDGPFVDEILINIYFTPEAEWLALETGEIDMTDWALPAEKVDEYAGSQWDGVLCTYDYAEYGYFLIDINHRNWPLSDLNFRRALAHLTPKDRIISEIVQGYGLPLASVVLPAHGEWLNPDLEDYDYDPTMAVSYLTDSGFTDTDGDDILNDPQTGDNLEPLDFFMRADDPLRNSAGNLIADEMEAVGIPVNRQIVERTVCYDNVMVQYTFDLYTGGWIFMTEPDYLYDLYHSDWAGTDEPWNLNYGGFTGADDENYAVKYSLSKEDAVENCHIAQEKMLEQVANIPLWTSVSVKACASGWEGFVNELGIGINSWWSFLNAKPAGAATSAAAAHAQEPVIIRYGFKSDIQTLNIIHSNWYWDQEVLGKIYDTLVTPDPFTREDVGILAESWTIEEWNTTGTKMIFNLKQDIKWHDDEDFTADDVVFSIDFLNDTGTPVYAPYLSDYVDAVAVDDYTVEVYLSAQSYFALHWIGWLPIFPEHLWEDHFDDWNTYEPTTPEELVGTGPFILSEYVPGEYVRLLANTEYLPEPAAPAMDYTLILVGVAVIVVVGGAYAYTRRK
jgi:peptide/nickel transport system substrate-binding protein